VFHIAELLHVSVLTELFKEYLAHVITGDAEKCRTAELFVETTVHNLNYSQDNSDYKRPTS